MTAAAFSSPSVQLEGALLVDVLAEHIDDVRVSGEVLVGLQVEAEQRVQGGRRRVLLEVGKKGGDSIPQSEFQLGLRVLQQARGGRGDRLVLVLREPRTDSKDTCGGTAWMR